MSLTRCSKCDEVYSNWHAHVCEPKSRPCVPTVLHGVVLRAYKADGVSALFVTDAGLLELRVEPSALIAMMEQAGKVVGEIIAQRPVDGV